MFTRAPSDNCASDFDAGKSRSRVVLLGAICVLLITAIAGLALFADRLHIQDVTGRFASSGTRTEQNYPVRLVFETDHAGAIPGLPGNGISQGPRADAAPIDAVVLPQDDHRAAGALVPADRPKIQTDGSQPAGAANRDVTASKTEPVTARPTNRSDTSFAQAFSEFMKPGESPAPKRAPSPRLLGVKFRLEEPPSPAPGPQEAGR